VILIEWYRSTPLLNNSEPSFHSHVVLLIFLAAAVSGWKPSLGLDLDFFITLRACLGVFRVQFSMVTTCVFVVDYQSVYYLLGCSHGPLCIQHHDALVSVVHHALLRDQPPWCSLWAKYWSVKSGIPNKKQGSNCIATMLSHQQPIMMKYYSGLASKSQQCFRYSRALAGSFQGV